jgi:hypothetical protein
MARKNDKDIYVNIIYSRVPQNPRMTRLPGYSTDDNLVVSEQISVTRGLRDKDLLKSHLILNLTKKKLEKNTYKLAQPVEGMISLLVNAYGKDLESSLLKITGYTETNGMEIPAELEMIRTLMSPANEPTEQKSELEQVGEEQQEAI